MDKQEIVKDDGRTLIYYTFPPSSPEKTDDAPQNAGGSAEAAHV